MAATALGISRTCEQCGRKGHGPESCGEGPDVMIAVDIVPDSDVNSDVECDAFMTIEDDPRQLGSVNRTGGVG